MLGKENTSFLYRNKIHCDNLKVFKYTSKKMVDVNLAENLVKEASQEAIQEINKFTKEVFHTRGGRIGSGMGLLLEGLWGYFVNKTLQSKSGVASKLEIAWITHHEYNDFACVLRNQPWDGDTRAGEVLRIEAKSMVAAADESKAHFDELQTYFGPNDLLVVLVWDWKKLDEYSFYPYVLDQYIGKAKDVAVLRDVLHIQRGGSFVDKHSCPDQTLGCLPTKCNHDGEPLNAKGKRERLTGPESCKPANVSYAANFGGLVRMLKSGNEQARNEFRKIRKSSDSAHDFISFIHRNLPDEEVNQYLKSEWISIAQKLHVEIDISSNAQNIRDRIADAHPNYRDYLREIF